MSKLVSYRKYLKQVADDLGVRVETVDELVGEMVWQAWWNGTEVRKIAGEIMAKAQNGR